VIWKATIEEEVMFCKCKGAEGEESEGRCGHVMKCKKCRMCMCLALLVLALVWYSKQDESKKRFLKHLGKQVPYLPARYYA
jgi:hypothetical protein